MRKYILTDANGVTASGQRLAAGKFIQTTGDSSKLMSRLSGCGADTPLLAVLISPIPRDQARLFNINCWNVGVDPKHGQSYTVIKEVETVPDAGPEQRLRFAVLVAKEACRDPDYRHWADQWLAGVDRSAASAAQALAAVEKELQAAADLEALGAWSENSGDSELAQRHDQGTQRARHVLRAVCMLDDPDKATSASMELAGAMAELDKLPAPAKLETLAELAVSPETLDRKSAG